MKSKIGLLGLTIILIVGTGCDRQGRAKPPARKSVTAPLNEAMPAVKNDLQLLIDSAEDGATVLVPKGVRTQPIEINKPLTLKGTSRTDCVLEVTANRPAIFVDAKGEGAVTIESLTIKWQLATSDRCEHPFAVGIKDTKAEVRDCCFLPLGNFKRCPVAIDAVGFSKLGIDACRFDGFEYTVCFGGGTEGAIRNSVVVGSGHQGISLYAGATAEIVGNVVACSKYHGLRSTGGTLYARNNLIINNANRGIYLGNKSASGVVTNNVIIGNATGISGFAASKVKIENNIIADSSYAGIGMRESCSLSIRDNIFRGNQRGLIRFEDGGRGGNALYRNTFWQNKTDTENLDKPADSITADPRLIDPKNGDFSLNQGPALEHKQGLTDPQVFDALWKRWKGRSDRSEPIADKASLAPNAQTTDARVEQKTRRSEGAATMTGHPGRIVGVVVDSVTGKPIAGAYVGAGDFGDSGGSNYSRHRSQGLHDKTKTDEDGRFKLKGLVFTDTHGQLKAHPLVVTHPDFVRHDRTIELPSDGPIPDIRVSLRPAAQIKVTVVDADGKPLEGHWLLRLEALDGRRFIPPGGDPHLSSFASSVWAHWPDMRRNMGVSQGFTFTELDTGEYSVEAIRFHLADNPTPQNIWKPTVTYHGSIPRLKIQASQNKELHVPPQDYNTRLTVTPPEFPDVLMGRLKRSLHAPVMCLLSRSPGLLLWDDNKIHHLEDHRLGRIDKKRFFRAFFSQDKPLTINNLPPGSYSLFTLSIYGEVASCLIGAPVDLTQGDTVAVEILWRQPDGASMVGPNHTFDYPVKLEARKHTIPELCELINTTTNSKPHVAADPAIADEALTFDQRQMSLWDLLEAIYLEKGWILEETSEKTLILRPPRSR